MKMSGGSFLSFICAFLLVAVLSWHAVAGQASDSQIALSKAIEINKQASAQLRAGQYEAAREALAVGGARPGVRIRRPGATPKPLHA